MLCWDKKPKVMNIFRMLLQLMEYRMITINGIIWERAQH